MTACQRASEAKRRGSGLHYGIEVYVPETGGGSLEFREKMNQQKIDAVEECKLFVENKLKKYRAVVRYYNV